MTMLIILTITELAEIRLRAVKLCDGMFLIPAAISILMPTVFIKLIMLLSNLRNIMAIDLPYRILQIRIREVCKEQSSLRCQRTLRVLWA